jgi:hypothetical protein
MNSQNQIRLHEIGQRDENISIFPSDFVQSDLILAVRVNAGKGSATVWVVFYKKGIFFYHLGQIP